MEPSPEWFADALRSGETDRVNEAIDRIEAMDPNDRLREFEALFDACAPVFESDDGYVRQSVVRFLRDAYPLLELRIAGSTADQVGGYSLDDMAEPRTRLVEFLLTAIDDEDGRVRRAVIDGIQLLGTAMTVAERSAERRALAESLESLTAARSGDKQKHIHEARETLETGMKLRTLLAGVEIPESMIDSDW